MSGMLAGCAVYPTNPYPVYAAPRPAVVVRRPYVVGPPPIIIRRGYRPGPWGYRGWHHWH